MVRWLLCFCLALPLAATAQEFPALHDITNVAGNDTLNIRSEPNASSNILGTFSPFAKEVEVIATDKSGKWGLVNINEGTGWVSRKYLRPSPKSTNAVLAQSFSCFGTEPFWTIHVTQGQTAWLTSPGQPDEIVEVGYLQPAQNRPQPFLLPMEKGNMAVIRRQFCQDGMSDHAYGLTIDLILPHVREKLVTGCCSIAP